MTRALLLAMCGMQVVAAANVFFAKIMPLESHGPMGWVAVAVTPNGLVGAGMAKGLEPKLLAAPRGENCTATNGCGTHVHSGTACTNATTQGGHYFAANAKDPWSPVNYTFTTHRGRALFKFYVETAAQDIAQKPFIIHNNAGERVACGLLDPIFSGKLPKHAALLLGMEQMPTIKDLEDDEEDHENELDDVDGEDDEDDEADDDDDDDDDDDEDDENDDEEEQDDDNGHEDDGEGRRLDATTILI